MTEETKQPSATTEEAKQSAAVPQDKDGKIINQFESFNLTKSILKGCTDAGFKLPSPIQSQAIPMVMRGVDLIAQAQTGTGKTAAFGLPTMSMLKNTGSVEILVITPTRELCTQVSDELFRLGKFADVRTVAVYGGQSISRQADLVNRGAQVLVATPGRLLDHLRSKRFKKFAPHTVILDEADEMLDMGFIEDLESIFAFLPEERQTLLFSATMPPAIQKLAQNILKSPEVIKITKKETTSTDINQRYYVMAEHERSYAMRRLMESEDPDKAIIFCRTKKETDQLSNSLIAVGYSARALHGDMDQRQRETSIQAFKRGQIDVLVATDVAARGLDVTGITHVFNFHMPFDAESYVHRIGRTGRAGQKGIAITLVSSHEYRAMKRIQEVTGAKLTLYEVPTIKEVEELQDKKTVDAILKQSNKREVSRILGKLLEDLDLQEISEKLISMLLEKNQISGPNQIGMNASQVEKLQSQLKNQRGGGGGKRYSGNRRNFGPKRYGNGGGGGGGKRRPSRDRKNS